jgi:cytochrome c-type biogenesis protein CcmH/NrfG
MAKSEFEKRADQLERQLHDLHGRLTEITKDYRAMLEAAEEQVRATTDQTGDNVAEAVRGVRTAARPWWIPVGVLALVIVVVMLATNRWIASTGSGETGA